jgi:hypothetical protein
MSRAAAVFRKRVGRASLLRGLQSASAKADEGRRPGSREALDE